MLHDLPSDLLVGLVLLVCSEFVDHLEAVRLCHFLGSSADGEGEGVVIRELALVEELTEVEDGLFFKGSHVLLLVDDAVALHLHQDLGNLSLGLLWVDARVVEGWVVGQTDDHSRLADSEVLLVLVEVSLCCGVDAVCSMAEVDGVQVRLQDLILGEPLLKLLSDNHLGYLTLCADLRVLEDLVLNQLLGKRRSTLNRATLELVDDGTQSGPTVNSMVRVEALVLDSNEAILKEDVYVRDGRVEVADGVELLEHVALCVPDNGRPVCLKSLLVYLGRDLVAVGHV